MAPEQGAWRRYGLALAAMLAAIFLTPPLRAVLGPTPFILYLAAAIFAAAHGGIGPALLVSAVCLLTFDEAILAGGNSRRLALFLAATLLLGWQSSARRRARFDLRFLSEAGKTLAASLDQLTTLDAVARLCVARLADACAVALREETGAVPLTAAAAADPRVDEVLRSLTLPAAEVTPTTDLLRGSLAFVLPRAASSPEDQRRLHSLGIREVVVVALRARGHTLGTLTLFRRRRFGWWRRSDLALAGELAYRAALALDNARLYATALRMKDALRQRADDLAAADRRKDVFLAVLAHEMCGPLSALSNLAEALRIKADATPETAWDLMGRQVDVLSRLAEDLLDVARIAQGKVELRRGPVLLADVVADATAATRPLIDGRRHTLTVSLPAPTPWLDGDRVRLAQVLINLITNAAKYTEPGGRIDVLGERVGDDVLLRVRDSGVGIPPELLPRVFDLFTQGDAPGAGPGGLGLGLALVRRLVEMHGGRVDAFSEGRGRGSEFRVRLPTCPPPPEECPTIPLRKGARIDESPRGRRVLVVDDNADAAATLGLLLETGGHQVAVAHDGPSALKVAEAFRPEVVLLDIGLPGIDGYQVARRLRRSKGTANALLVALSGYAHDDHRRRCRDAGFDHSVAKPVDPDELSRLLREGRGGREAVVRV